MTLQDKLSIASALLSLVQFVGLLILTYLVLKYLNRHRPAEFIAEWKDTKGRTCQLYEDKDGSRFTITEDETGFVVREQARDSYPG